MSTAAPRWFESLGAPLDGQAQAAVAQLLARIPTFARATLARVKDAEEAESVLRQIDMEGAWWDTEELERERLWVVAAERLGEEALLAALAVADATAAHAFAVHPRSAPLPGNATLARAARDALLLAMHQLSLARLAQTSEHWFVPKHALFAAGHWMLGCHHGRLLVY